MPCKLPQTHWAVQPSWPKQLMTGEVMTSALSSLLQEKSGSFRAWGDSKLILEMNRARYEHSNYMDVGISTSGASYSKLNQSFVYSTPAPLLAERHQKRHLSLEVPSKLHKPLLCHLCPPYRSLSRGVDGCNHGVLHESLQVGGAKPLQVDGCNYDVQHQIRNAATESSLLTYSSALPVTSLQAMQSESL